MIVRAAGYQANAAPLKLIGQRRGVEDDLVLIGFEIVAQILLEADGLGRNNVHQRPALGSGEDGGIDLFPQLLLAEDQCAAGSAQSLVRRGGDHIGIGHGARVLPGGHKAGDVGHVHHEISAHRIGDLAHAFKVDGAGIGAGARNQEFGPLLLRALPQSVIVDLFSLRIDTVEGGVKVLAGDRGFRAVGQMTALAEVHAHDGVARLQQGKVYRHIGLRAGMGLHIGMLCAEELLGPLNGKAFHLVHILAAAVITCAGIALGILVGQMAAHGLHDRRGDKVLRGNELNMIPLA